MPRILAIDYGQKRTGIAVTDELQIIASGLTTTPSETVLTFLKSYLTLENVNKILVGDPKQMNGEPSESAAMIDNFVVQLESNSPTFQLFVLMNVLLRKWRYSR